MEIKNNDYNTMIKLRNYRKVNKDKIEKKSKRE